MGLAFSAVSGVASAAASCLVGSAASCVCAGLKQILPSGYTAAKVYALLLFFGSVLAAILLRVNQPVINAKYFEVKCSGQYTDRCYGFQAVYRISFVDFFFFLAIAIGSKASVNVHTHAWGLKYVAYTAALFGMFFVDNDVFNGYVHLARIMSLIYLIAQVVTLVNFSYMLHERIMEKASQAEHDGDDTTAKVYKAFYLLVSGLCLGGSLSAIGLLFHYYGRCRVSQLWISLTLILSLACLASSLMPQVNMGLLTPSFLFLYFCYQCWSAILSNPDVRCNYTASATHGVAKDWNTVVSLVFLALSLTYTGWSTYQSLAGTALTEQIKSAQASQAYGTSEPKLKEALTGDKAAAGGSVQSPPTSDDGHRDAEKAEGAVPNLTASDEMEASYIWCFHLLLALAGAYMAMAITNWGNPEGKPDTHDTTVGTESMWLKIVAQWLTIILYAWSLWAPYMRGEVEG